MLDSKAENLYQVVINKRCVSGGISYEILAVGSSIIKEVCHSVMDAKRKARKKLEDLGVKFRKEMRFKKHEVNKRRFYQSVRTTK